MFYLLLKPLMRVAIWLYFGKIRREGLGHIDNGRPSIILANHTASFMDAMITAVYVKRRIWFFTRGDVFRYRWISALLRSLGMLPVYRMRDGKERLQENASSNDEALRILSRGGAVLIFAEGESAVDKRLKPPKKGPFRLAIRAADSLGQQPAIVPLGINYVLPSAPGGDAYLAAGPPFEIPAGNAITAARRATELMRESWTRLFPLCWHVENPALRPPVQFLLEHMQLLSATGSFPDTKKLMDTLNVLDNYHVGAEFLKDWQEFRLWQREIPLPKAFFWPKATNTDRVAAIAGLPLALAGWVFHAIPLSAAQYITQRRVKEPDFVSPVFLCLAVIFCTLWYAVMIALCFMAERPDRLWIPLLLMPVSGVFLLKVWRQAAYRMIAPLARAGYRRQNPQSGLVQRLFDAMMLYARRAVQREA